MAARHVSEKMRYIHTSNITKTFRYLCYLGHFLQFKCQREKFKVLTMNTVKTTNALN